MHAHSYVCTYVFSYSRSTYIPNVFKMCSMNEACCSYRHVPIILLLSIVF